MIRVTSALAALCFIAGAAHAAPACNLKQVGELPISVVDGDLVVDATVNGSPIKMEVNTGASFNTLYRTTAVKLGLQPKQIVGGLVYGPGGPTKLYEVGVKKLAVGAYEADGVDFMIVGGDVPHAAGGWLGTRFLLHYDAEFDLPEGKIRFFKPEGCGGDQVVYWNKAYSVVPNISPSPDLSLRVDLKLNGSSIHTAIDSGFTSSFITTQTATRYANHAIPPEKAEDVVGIGRNVIPSRIEVVPSFSFGDETVKNARLRVADLFDHDRYVYVGSRFGNRVIDPPQMILGVDFFRSHRVYISNSQRKIYVSYMGGPVFDTRHIAEATPQTLAPKP